MSWAIAAVVTVDAFDEALEWFDSKHPLTQDELDKAEDDARARAFTLAAHVELQVVQTVFDEMRRSIEKGTPYEEFVKAVGGKLDDFPVPGHVLETTFINNVQQSYNTGRWYQITDPALTVLRPYLMYDSVLDGRTTPHCKEWDGVVRPASDPCWLNHNPQCHHRCRAGLRSIRESEAMRRGPTVSLPSEKASQGFGLAPPLRPDIPTPNIDRIDNDAWDEFMDRQAVAKIELETANAAARAARASRALQDEQQTPEYWFDKEFRSKYGEDAGKAVAWGKAMEQRGRLTLLAEAETAYDSLQADYGIEISEAKGLFHRLRSAQRSEHLADLTTLGDAIDAMQKHFDESNDFDIELPEARALAGLIGQKKSVASHGAALQFGKPKFRGKVPDVIKAAAPKLAIQARNFYADFSDTAVQHADKGAGYSNVWTDKRGVFNAAKKTVNTGFELDAQGVVRRNGLRTLVHELGHGVEELNPWALKAAGDFLERRTQGERLRKLKDIFADEGVKTRYGPRELARKDKFINPYMGKEYIDPRNGRRYASEVSSMAIENLHSSPDSFLRKDVESFWFALGQLAGAPSK